MRTIEVYLRTYIVFVAQSTHLLFLVAMGSVCATAGRSSPEYAVLTTASSSASLSPRALSETSLPQQRKRWHRRLRHLLTGGSPSEETLCLCDASTGSLSGLSDAAQCGTLPPPPPSPSPSPPPSLATSGPLRLSASYPHLRRRHDAVTPGCVSAISTRGSECARERCELWPQLGAAAMVRAHSSPETAKHALDVLRSTLEDRRGRGFTMRNALEDAFAAANSELSLSGAPDDGCVALVCAVGREHTCTMLFCAALGDQRAYLLHQGKNKNATAQELTVEMHTTENRDERARVVRAGGAILRNRVNGVLTVTRSLGDACYGTAVSAVPVVTCVPCAPGSIVVLCSKGVHTAIGARTAYVLEMLLPLTNSAQDLANAVTATACPDDAAAADCALCSAIVMTC